MSKSEKPSDSQPKLATKKNKDNSSGSSSSSIANVTRTEKPDHCKKQESTPMPKSEKPSDSQPKPPTKKNKDNSSGSSLSSKATETRTEKTEPSKNGTELGANTDKQESKPMPNSEKPSDSQPKPATKKNTDKSSGWSSSSSISTVTLTEEPEDSKYDTALGANIDKQAVYRKRKNMYIAGNVWPKKGPINVPKKTQCAKQNSRPIPVKKSNQRPNAAKQPALEKPGTVQKAQLNNITPDVASTSKNIPRSAPPKQVPPGIISNLTSSPSTRDVNKTLVGQASAPKPCNRISTVAKPDVAQKISKPKITPNNLEYNFGKEGLLKKDGKGDSNKAHNSKETNREAPASSTDLTRIRPLKNQSTAENFQKESKIPCAPSTSKGVKSLLKPPLSARAPSKIPLPPTVKKSPARSPTRKKPEFSPNMYRSKTDFIQLNRDRIALTPLRYNNRCIGLHSTREPSETPPSKSSNREPATLQTLENDSNSQKSEVQTTTGLAKLLQNGESTETTRTPAPSGSTPKKQPPTQLPSEGGRIQSENDSVESIVQKEMAAETSSKPSVSGSTPAEQSTVTCRTPAASSSVEGTNGMPAVLRFSRGASEEQPPMKLPTAQCIKSQLSPLPLACTPELEPTDKDFAETEDNDTKPSPTSHDNVNSTGVQERKDESELCKTSRGEKRSTVNLTNHSCQRPERAIVQLSKNENITSVLQHKLPVKTSAKPQIFGDSPAKQPPAQQLPPGRAIPRSLEVETVASLLHYELPESMVTRPPLTHLPSGRASMHPSQIDTVASLLQYELPARTKSKRTLSESAPAEREKKQPYENDNDANLLQQEVSARTSPKPRLPGSAAASSMQLPEAPYIEGVLSHSSSELTTDNEHKPTDKDCPNMERKPPMADDGIMGSKPGKHFIPATKLGYNAIPFSPLCNIRSFGSQKKVGNKNETSTTSRYKDSSAGPSPSSSYKQPEPVSMPPENQTDSQKDEFVEVIRHETKTIVESEREQPLPTQSTTESSNANYDGAKKLMQPKDEVNATTPTPRNRDTSLIESGKLVGLRALSKSPEKVPLENYDGAKKLMQPKDEVSATTPTPRNRDTSLIESGKLVGLRALSESPEKVPLENYDGAKKLMQPKDEVNATTPTPRNRDTSLIESGKLVGLRALSESPEKVPLENYDGAKKLMQPKDEVNATTPTPRNRDTSLIEFGKLVGLRALSKSPEKIALENCDGAKTLMQPKDEVNATTPKPRNRGISPIKSESSSTDSDGVDEDSWSGVRVTASGNIIRLTREEFESKMKSTINISSDDGKGISTSPKKPVQDPGNEKPTQMSPLARHINTPRNKMRAPFAFVHNDEPAKPQPTHLGRSLSWKGQGVDIPLEEASSTDSDDIDEDCWRGVRVTASGNIIRLTREEFESEMKSTIYISSNDGKGISTSPKKPVQDPGNEKPTQMSPLARHINTPRNKMRAASAFVHNDEPVKTEPNHLGRAVSWKGQDVGIPLEDCSGVIRHKQREASPTDSDDVNDGSWTGARVTSSGNIIRLTREEFESEMKSTINWNWNDGRAVPMSPQKPVKDPDLRRFANSINPNYNFEKGIVIDPSGIVTRRTDDSHETKKAGTDESSVQNDYIQTENRHRPNSNSSSCATPEPAPKEKLQTSSADDIPSCSNVLKVSKCDYIKINPSSLTGDHKAGKNKITQKLSKSLYKQGSRDVQMSPENQRQKIETARKLISSKFFDSKFISFEPEIDCEEGLIVTASGSKIRFTSHSRVEKEDSTCKNEPTTKDHCKPNNIEAVNSSSYQALAPDILKKFKNTSFVTIDPNYKSSTIQPSDNNMCATEIDDESSNHRSRSPQRCEQASSRASSSLSFPQADSEVVQLYNNSKFNSAESSYDGQHSPRSVTRKMSSQHSSNNATRKHPYKESCSDASSNQRAERLPMLSVTTRCTSSKTVRHSKGATSGCNVVTLFQKTSFMRKPSDSGDVTMPSSSFKNESRLTGGGHTQKRHRKNDDYYKDHTAKRSDYHQRKSEAMPSMDPQTACLCATPSGAPRTYEPNLLQHGLPDNPPPKPPRAGGIIYRRIEMECDEPVEQPRVEVEEEPCVETTLEPLPPPCPPEPCPDPEPEPQLTVCVNVPSSSKQEQDPCRRIASLEQEVQALRQQLISMCSDGVHQRDTFQFGTVTQKLKELMAQICASKNTCDSVPAGPQPPHLLDAKKSCESTTATPTPPQLRTEKKSCESKTAIPLQLRAEKKSCESKTAIPPPPQLLTEKKSCESKTAIPPPPQLRTEKKSCESGAVPPQPQPVFTPCLHKTVSAQANIGCEQCDQPSHRSCYHDFADRATQITPISSATPTPCSSSTSVGTQRPQASPQRRSKPRRQDTTTDTSDCECPICRSVEACRNVVTSNLRRRLFDVIGNHDPSQVMVTVVAENGGIYHIIITTINTREPLGCFYATEEAVETAKTEHLFDKIFTFFVADTDIEAANKAKMFKHTFHTS